MNLLEGETISAEAYFDLPLENTSAAAAAADAFSEETPIIRINASDVAKFLLLTNFGKNPDAINDSDTRDLINSYLNAENQQTRDVEIALDPDRVQGRRSAGNTPNITDKALQELLKVLGHLWGDPKDAGIYYERSTPAVTQLYNPLAPTPEQPTANSIPEASSVFTPSSGNTSTPVFPWNIEDSQDGIASVLSSNSTECISQLVEASQWCYLYGVGFLLITAFFLNGVSLVVFQAKPLRRLSFSVYLTALAVTDTVALFGHIPRKWLNILYLSLGWGTGVTFYDTNTVACKALTFVSYVFRFMSSWLLVGLACERLSVSSNPYKPSKLRTVKSAGHAIVYCVIAALIFNSHVLFTWRSVSIPDAADLAHSCVPMAPSDFISVALTITTILTIVGLPFVVISLVTIFTVRNLGAWALRPRRLSARAICRALLEKQATSMVVVLSGMFCILSVPYTISWVVLLVQHFTAKSTTSVCTYIEMSAARDISEVGFMVTYALKFLVCIFTGRAVLSSK